MTAPTALREIGEVVGIERQGRSLVALVQLKSEAHARGIMLKPVYAISDAPAQPIAEGSER